MAEITITVRGVDLEVWKEFQKRIIDIHGNLYGNLGIEVTHALELWLDKKSEEYEDQQVERYIILNVGKNSSVSGNPNLKTLLTSGLWGLKKRWRKQWEKIEEGDTVLIYCSGGIRAKGRIINKNFNPNEPVEDWDEPYGYPYQIRLKLDNVKSKKRLPKIVIPHDNLKNIIKVPRPAIWIIEDKYKSKFLRDLIERYF